MSRLLDWLLQRPEPVPRAERDGSLTLDDLGEFFSFGGNVYPLVQTTMGEIDKESISSTAVGAIKSNSPIFALVLARLQAFSQVRFQWTRFSGSQPSDLFGTPELQILERPWPGGTTSDLLARMELHASAAGQAYVTRPKRDRLSLLRPDQVTIVMGSQTDEDSPSEAPDTEIVGWIHTTARGKATFYGPREVAHYAPIPDPDARFLGMSWITAALREMQSDNIMTEHKNRFLSNAATPNLAVKFDASITQDQARAFKELMESEHRGALNAWKTLYLGGGADVTVVGKDFRQLDFSTVQGKGETRLASCAGVPPSWVGFSEGLQGSALNSGNYTAARRRFADGTISHLWCNAATSLEVLVDQPRNRNGQLIEGANLWFDPRVPFTRDDAADVAKIQSDEAQTIATLVREGYTPESVVRAVKNNDWSLMVHSGWYSVQLQQPPPADQQPASQGSNGQGSNGQGSNGQGSNGRPVQQTAGVGA